MKIAQYHHLYVGLLAVGIAWIAIFKAEDFVLINAWAWGLFGVWMIADDLYQHQKQRGTPSYRSPVNRLYHWLKEWLP